MANASGSRFSRLCQVLCCLLCFLVLLAVIAVILAFTVFRLRPPTSEVVSANVSSVSPVITVPVNVTLALVVLIHNPNRASFLHPLPGHSQLLYHGIYVGDGELAPGKIPARGSEQVKIALTLHIDRVASQLGQLVSDIMAGAVGLDVETRLSGQLNLFGFIKHHTVASSDCHVVVGFPELKVRSTECKRKTKL